MRNFLLKKKIDAVKLSTGESVYFEYSVVEKYLTVSLGYLFFDI